MGVSVSKKERIVSLDIIRGLALFGILFMNLGAYRIIVEGGGFPDFTGVNGYIESFIDMFIEKKFFSMFSFLFGIGFYIFSSRTESRGDKPLWRFARRLLGLLLIGIIHLFYFWASVLVAYAIVGFLLLPFYRASAATISKWIGGLIAVHSIAIILMLIAPNVKAISVFFNIFGNDTFVVLIMFLSGFLVAKLDWIRKVSELTKEFRWIQVITLPLFIGFSVWIWFASQNDSDQILLIISLGVIPTVYFYLTCLFMIFENNRLAKMCEPFAMVGRMALTNYLAQNFIGLALINLWGLKIVSPMNIIVLAPIVYSIQVIYSVLWFKFFKMGPAEKVWRFMTYGFPQK